MHLSLSAPDEAFRNEVRAFLDEALTPQMREAGRRMTSVFNDPAQSLPWQAKLHAKGWVAPSWPAEYGGTGWSEMQRYVFASVLYGILDVASGRKQVWADRWGLHNDLTLFNPAPVT